MILRQETMIFETSSKTTLLVQVSYVFYVLCCEDVICLNGTSYQISLGHPRPMSFNRFMSFVVQSGKRRTSWDKLPCLNHVFPPTLEGIFLRHLGIFHGGYRAHDLHMTRGHHPPPLRRLPNRPRASNPPLYIAQGCTFVNTSLLLNEILFDLE